MDNAALVGIVVGFPVKVVGEFLPRPVSGGGNGGLALAGGRERGASPLPLRLAPVSIWENRKPPENQSVKMTLRFRATNRILFDCQSVEYLVDCMILCSLQSYLICPIRQSGWASQIETMSSCCSTAAWYPSGSNPIKRTE